MVEIEKLKLDRIQMKLMEEDCILVDEKDRVIGNASKKECHLMKNIDNGMLHRAFSVFLFNNKNQLLLQKRSSSKITFPDHWTNTCCSHPLNNEIEKNETGNEGIKMAAIRKLNHELGIPKDSINLKDIKYITRIKYESENSPKDGIWGEHEIDYILIIQKDVNEYANEDSFGGKIIINKNLNEVSEVRYVNEEELKKILDSKVTKVTPWFRLICSHYLFKWWREFPNIKTDHNNIHNF